MSIVYKADDSRYEKMTFKRCGRSGLKLPLVSLGLWHNFGGVDSYENSREIILHAFDQGITHIDLANNYGPPPGSAEEVFGSIMDKDLKTYRDELIISTKAGYMMWPGPYGEWGSKKYLTASLDQSLKRMNLDYVDIFYSHRFDPETPLEETMEALALAVKSGKALYVGISSYNSQQTRAAHRILSDMGVRCLIHQPSYSMLNRWTEQDGLYQTLAELGMGSIVFSPLAQGLLTNRYLHGIPQDSRAGKPHGYLQSSSINEQLLYKINQLNEMAEKRGQTLAQMALTWVLREPQVTSVLIGVSSKQQLDDNLEIIQARQLSADEIQNIENILQN